MLELRFLWQSAAAGDRLNAIHVGFRRRVCLQPSNSGSLTTEINGFLTSSGVDPGTNQVQSSNASGAAAFYTYDAAGDVTYDGTNLYLYDGAGRICAVKHNTGISDIYTLTGYIYSAEGVRTAKGSLSQFICDTNSADSTYNGFAATNIYIVGPSGEQITEVAPHGSPSAPATCAASWCWVHTNVFGGGLDATYTADSTGRTGGASLLPPLRLARYPPRRNRLRRQSG